MENYVRPLDRIIEVRNIFKVTQKDFAKRIGCTSQLISMIETGKAGLSFSKAKLIEHEYGVSAMWLLTGEGKMMINRKENENTELSFAFNYFPEIIKALNVIAGHLDLEDWCVLNHICKKINRTEESEDKIS